ncbi:MAG: hypothetical protein MZW92_07895 [Comamonadaceae bacterium]|nr:hypothetical protein [Comamonadaceae bacterium]
MTYLIRLRLHRVRAGAAGGDAGIDDGLDRGAQLGLLALRRILARLQGVLRRAAVGYVATKILTRRCAASSAEFR